MIAILKHVVFKMETEKVFNDTASDAVGIDPPSYDESTLENLGITLRVANARQKRPEGFINESIRPHIEDSAKAGISNNIIAILPRSSLSEIYIKTGPFITIDKWDSAEERTRTKNVFVCDEVIEFLRQRETIHLLPGQLRQYLSGCVELKPKKIEEKPSPKSKDSGGLRGVVRKMIGVRSGEIGCSSFTPEGWKS